MVRTDPVTMVAKCFTTHGIVYPFRSKNPVLAF